MSMQDDITKDAIQILSTYLPKVERDNIKLSSHVIKDLKLLSDDASEFAMLLTQKYKPKPPLKEWRTVGTVEEAINLVLKYAETKVK